MGVVRARGGSAFAPGNQTKQIVELDSNEAALCACHAYFPAADELFLVVGSVVGLTFAPRDCAGGFLSLYKYDADGSAL